jgi:D-3-phosphoglycerate dehydrogenase / 2-oxoglutarate reductase
MKALITASFHPDGLARLRRHMEVVHEDWRLKKTFHFDCAKFAEHLRHLGADVLIVEADLVRDEVLELGQLKLIGSCRGDPINIDVERATALGLPVLFAPARNADAVADLTLAFMLALARHVYEVNFALKTGQMSFASTKEYLDVYERYGGFELGSATVGIVGLGAIGQRVARRCAAFGARVLAYDPAQPAASFSSCGATSSSLEEMLPQSDILTIHCPEMPATYQLIGREQIARLKRGAYLLNLARASIVDDDAFYEALVSGHLAGAGLDVFRDEPVQPDNRFCKLPNVLVAPHLGGATRDVVRHQTEMIVDGVEAWLRGERPRLLANPQVEIRRP